MYNMTIILIKTIHLLKMNIHKIGHKNVHFHHFKIIYIFNYMQ